jgi:hypothetical protein
MNRDIEGVKAILGLAFYIAIPIIKDAKKDGFQWTDLMAFMSDPNFKSYFEKTIANAKNIGEEFKDLSLEEGFELAGFTLTKVQDLVSAIKKS